MPQLESSAFYRAVLDTIADNLCVIDRSGQILYVNRRWKEFAADNGGRSQRAPNYLEVCDRAARNGDDDARKVAQGLRTLMAGRIEDFTLEYPCHSPTQKRWFVLAAQRLRWSQRQLFVIKHRDTTDRKLAELEVLRLSQTDALTGLGNRMYFEQVLDKEWRAHQRDNTPLAMLMLDLDHFKRLNDEHGHLAGDACLEELGRLLNRYARRPRDLAVRYGGEEFVLVLSDTDQETATRRAEALRREIADLRIRHGDQPALTLTASIGVTSRVPETGQDWKAMLEIADQALYAAKRGGRDQVCVGSALQAEPKAVTTHG